MQKKQGNPVWNFFASVKLALFTLFVLAGASIFGTIWPQNDPGKFAIFCTKYFSALGNPIKIFEMLNFDDMYHSWWFLFMLGLFSVNLIVCTIERLPHIWKVVVLDNLATTKVDRLKKMAMRRSFSTGISVDQAGTAVSSLMSEAGWKMEQEERDGGLLFFTQKGAWTRLGVIVVHISILVIFVGAIIGVLFGYKASVMIPEGSSTQKVYESIPDHPEIPLGFTVKCNAFYLTYYDTGAPKEFRSDLQVVNSDNQVVLEKSIVVNDPMQYGGLTFYQSSYQAIDGQYSARIKNETSGAEQNFVLTPQRERKWPAENVTFGITNISGPDMMRRYRYKIWFSDGKAGPSEFWITEGSIAKIKRPEATYEFSAKPRFATGLQVVKDPGVWTVYIGCGLMIVGLIIIFYMSHRRIWVFVSKNEGEDTSILISGLSNKNKIGFENTFASLYENFEEDSTLNINKS